MKTAVETQTHSRAPRRFLKLLLTVPSALILIVLAFFAWQQFFPVQASEGWRYQVLHDDVFKAASMVINSDGSLVVSQELRDGKGSILRIRPDGHRETVVGGLSKPDGMVAAQGGWVFSQEVEGAMVNFFKDGQIKGLFKGASVQGLWNEGDALYAIEDRKGDGRLMRYRWSDQSLKVLRSGLSETESITRCTDGRMLYTEKEKGVIHQLTEDGRDPVVLGGFNQPTFLMCDQRGLWISEDSTHRARLLLIDPQGAQHTVLSFLKAPQAIIPTGRGTYLLAEGGRDRILELTPDR
ncbi:hypothetical protein N5D61_26310 [Pseudomonas sp. GD03842]|uniref:hypothetical protein n=1 Tax=Pseudomonas sp. GD03842 TaxID=2975385 RepID=UPI002447CC47|nr:hypothetical protein [Pseudomonas sp. GD03842]MDH0749849.1 hypothetical protein [Pseudomonas sp. GD03842]